MKREDYLKSIDRLISDCTASRVERPVSAGELTALREIRAAFELMAEHLRDIKDMDAEARQILERIETGQIDEILVRECPECRWLVSELEYSHLRFQDMLCPRCRNHRMNRFTCVYRSGRREKREGIVT